jgi:hypothetical protein
VNNTKRRSQLVIPFGIGAIVDFKDETLMSAGQNFWAAEFNPNKDEIIEATEITDQRLQDRLTEVLQRRSDPIMFFLQPTVAPSRGKIKQAINADMPFVRFPGWHFCSICKGMQKVQLHQRNIKKCSLQNPNTKRVCNGLLTPIRFLLACKSGHISDFPWKNWLWSGEVKCEGNECQLYFESTGKSGLDGTIVRCSKCSKIRNMAGSMGNGSKLVREVLPDGQCLGEKPWLGSDEENDNCLAEIATIQRGASNTYFANTVSSILIPPYSQHVRNLIDKSIIWNAISEELLSATIDEVDGTTRFDIEQLTEGISKVTKALPKFRGISVATIVETALVKYRASKNEKNYGPVDEISFKRKEFEAFLGERPSKEDRRDFDIIKMDMGKYSDVVRKLFDQIILVTSLRETRVLTGFSRLVPGVPGQEQVKMYKSGQVPKWLPATEVRGEGIFLKFNYKTLSSWKAISDDFLGPKSKIRADWVVDVETNNKPNYTRAEKVSSELIFIHTFSHLLIRQLIYDAGYDTSSIRERLYVSDDPHNKMFGLLIYTASGDSEGTLGGLVSRGLPENLEQTLAGSFLAEVCSNDPICIETTQQGIEGLNGGACHSCSLLPETSCEHNNTLLDRVFLFGDEKHRELGLINFLKSIIL